MKEVLNLDSGSRSRRLVVVGTGTANVGSVVNMWRRLGVEPVVSVDRRELDTAERLLLPGVGAFDAGMRSLLDSGVAQTLRERAEDGVPILGICLGMQLLFDGSEEGDMPGLGLIPGRVRRLAADSPAGRVPIPHMGWSRIVRQADHRLLDGVGEDSRFYFVHSYVVVPSEDKDIVGISIHGNPFVSIVSRGSVSGVQFHPEKSHRFGKTLLANFLGEH